MPDNIIFNTIPTDIRTPGQYVEIDNAKALRGLPSLNRRILVVGNKRRRHRGPLTLCRVNSGDEGATLFGRGSVLHEMLRLARAANKTSDIWALGVEDLAAGVAATKTITVTGPPPPPARSPLHQRSEAVDRCGCWRRRLGRRYGDRCGRQWLPERSGHGSGRGRRGDADRASQGCLYPGHRCAGQLL